MELLKEVGSELLFWKQVSAARVSTEGYLSNGWRRARPHGSCGAACQQSQTSRRGPRRLPVPCAGGRKAACWSPISAKPLGPRRQEPHFLKDVLRLRTPLLLSLPQRSLSTPLHQDPTDANDVSVLQPFIQNLVMWWMTPAQPPTADPRPSATRSHTLSRNGLVNTHLCCCINKL